MLFPQQKMGERRREGRLCFGGNFNYLSRTLQIGIQLCFALDSEKEYLDGVIINVLFSNNFQHLAELKLHWHRRIF